MPNEPIDYLYEYIHGVDEKRRVQIPAKWRPAPEDLEFRFRLVLWQLEGQPRPCLLAMPPEVWQQLRTKVNAMPFADPRAETLRRTLTKNADSVALDGTGRICLPQTMADAAGITKKAVLVGMMDRFQIWSPEHYEAVSAADAASAPQALKLI